MGKPAEGKIPISFHSRESGSQDALILSQACMTEESSQVWLYEVQGVPSAPKEAK